MKQTRDTSGENLQLASSQSVTLWPLALPSLPHGEDELADRLASRGPGHRVPEGQSADPCHG